MSDSTDLRQLFADYASGAISAEHLQTLEAALRADDELRRQFVEYLNVDSALSDLAALSDAEVAEIETAEFDAQSTADIAGDSTPRGQTSLKSAWSYRMAAVVGAIAGSMLVAAILWFAVPGADEKPPVATLVTDVDAVLFWDGRPWSNPELPAGEYRLDRGLLHVRFGGGVMVYVEAPARFDVVSGNRLLLHSGRLSANVPPEGVGFTVETPEAEVIDFGTEFSVDVEAGASEVHVFEGFVRVQPRSRKDGKSREAVDLRTAQAVKIDASTERPVEIELATDRFIRNFDEPKQKYVRSIKRLLPVAYYRMPIRDKGLASEPSQYSGVVLTGEGTRPPHARGVFTGGSLRVLADSTGRGGRVDTPPPLRTGQFTLAVFVYLETRSHDGTVATNIRGDDGNFTLSLDGNGAVQATVRNDEGHLHSVSSDAIFPLQTWCQLVVTVDGEQLCIYENGRMAASSPCSLMADTDSASLWFGTDADGLRLWNGRIDELALFDKALSDVEITDLYDAAVEEMARSE